VIDTGEQNARTHGLLCTRQDAFNYYKPVGDVACDYASDYSYAKRPIFLATLIAEKQAVKTTDAKTFQEKFKKTLKT